ncbi:uncharacterized protein FOMMEDRAFT_87648, partial [Fomitiporia mediterranea MF3/22]|uniref:uncharacterized protein n=1 Tax=Fomitiporia mediterranea (strain MF3/22) TaxID=694068 RepID=UPI0004408BE8
VEKVLFKVPRHPFEDESELFKDMFALPPGGDRLPEGSSDSEPFVLHDVTMKDFEALLKVLLPDPYVSVLLLLFNCSFQDEWISVLRLAHMWDFNRLFLLAIKKLEALPMDPVTKIVLARTYTVTKWLRPAYFDLTTRTDPLTLEESRALDIDTVVKLNIARDFHFKWIIEGEEAKSPRFNSLTPTCTVPYYKSKGAKVTLTRSSYWDCDDVKVDHRGLEAAVHSVLTGLFRLHRNCYVP